MEYHSVAIIVYEDICDKYLVVADEARQYSFFPTHIYKAIGAYFDFNRLIKFLEKELKTTNLRKLTTKEFFAERDYLGKDRPATTVYKFTIPERIHSNLSLEKKFKWISLKEIEFEEWRRDQEWIIRELQNVKFRKIDSIPNYDTHVKGSFYEYRERKTQSSIKLQKRKFFVLYHQTDHEHLEALRRFLRPYIEIGKIELSSDPIPGELIDDYNTDNMNSSDYILIMLSSYFLSCDKCVSLSLEARQLGEKCIPVLVKPCYWEIYFDNITILPQNGRPIMDGEWSSIDDAYKSVTDELLRLL